MGPYLICEISPEGGPGIHHRVCCRQRTLMLARHNLLPPGNGKYSSGSCFVPGIPRSLLGVVSNVTDKIGIATILIL